MVFPFLFTYNQCQLWFDISKGVTALGTKDVRNGTCQPCPVVDIKKVEHRGNALASSRRSLYLVQWYSGQRYNSTSWLSGYRVSDKMASRSLVLGQWPHPCKVRRVKGVRMRGDFSNPACKKIIDSY